MRIPHPVALSLSRGDAENGANTVGSAGVPSASWSEHRVAWGRNGMDASRGADHCAVGSPGPSTLSDLLPGPFGPAMPGAADRRAGAFGQSSVTTTLSASLSFPEIPRTTFTFSSISAISAGLSFRYIFAFSRPWPIFWP